MQRKVESRKEVGAQNFGRLQLGCSKTRQDARNTTKTKSKNVHPTNWDANQNTVRILLDQDAHPKHQDAEIIRILITITCLDNALVFEKIERGLNGGPFGVVCFSKNTVDSFAHGAKRGMTRVVQYFMEEMLKKAQVWGCCILCQLFNYAVVI